MMTRPPIAGAQVWYQEDEGKPTLGSTTPQMRQAVPGDVRPDGSQEETSDKGRRMFPNPVPSLRLDAPPEEREGAKTVVGGIEDLFEWLESVRTDIWRNMADRWGNT